jgi:TolB-like protein/Flp pilus assembly protein TadD
MAKKIRLGSADVNFDTLTIDREGHAHPVEPKVMDVLHLMSQNAGSVLTRDELIEGVWGAEYGGDERLSRAISLLRKALGEKRGSGEFIQTVPKRGYRLVAPVSQRPETGAPASDNVVTLNITQKKVPLNRRGGAPSLAVIPFTNRSGDPDLDVFAFGIAEDLIEALSQGVDVRVKASSATARFGVGPAPDLKAMAQELDVRYVLQGSIRHKKTDLQVSTLLIEAASGDVLWSQKFTTPIEKLADMQEELILKLAAHLRTQAHRVEIERALHKTEDITAWQAVMRSLSALRHMTPISLMQALTEAKLAAQIDPAYGLAQALVAQMEGIIYNQMMPDNKTLENRILELANTAIRLDPDNSTVLSSAASAMIVSGSTQEGLEIGKRSLQLNPNNQYGYAICGMASALLDQTEAALTYFDQEVALAPGDVTLWISYGWRACALIRANRWEDAHAAIRIALDMTPDNAAPNISAAIILRHLGNEREAIEHIAKARRLEPETSLDVWKLRFSRAYANNANHDMYLSNMQDLWSLASL